MCRESCLSLLASGTYTHPEVAHVGKYEAELDAAGVQYESFVRELAPVDRCAKRVYYRLTT